MPVPCLRITLWTAAEDLLGDLTRGPGFSDKGQHRELRHGLVEAKQQLDERIGQGTGAARIGAGLRYQGLKATLAIAFESIPEGLRGDRVRVEPGLV